MPQIEFVGQSARDGDAITANPSRLINCYREVVVSGGRSAYNIKSVLGTQDFVSLPNLFIRALSVVGDKLFAAANGTLYEVGADFQDIGTIEDDAATTIAGNEGKVTVTCGGEYFLWDGATLTNPTPGAFSNFGALDYIGGYTVLTERAGRRFQWSDQADPSDLPGLNFATADGKDDNLIRPLALNGMLYLFKELSYEVWYLTGEAGANVFARQAGGVVDVGLKSHNLITKIQGGAFMVGSDNRAHIISANATPVSIPPVETAIRQSTPRACFTYEDEGHTFCVITFVDAPAWVYDVATGEWHERAQGADLQPWAVTCSVLWRGEWHCGNDDGSIRRFARVPSDGALPLVREMTSRTLYQDGQRFRVSELELFPRQGLTSGLLELFVSRDGGMTWTEGKAREIGPIGNYAGRVIWRQLGLCRSLTVRARVSEVDPFSMLAEGRVA